MTRHVQQPAGSKLCGHACLAMYLHKSLDYMIGVVGHKHGVSNKEVLKVLARSGRFTPLRRYQTVYAQEGRASFLRVKWPNKIHHLVYVEDNVVYDPTYARPAPTLAMWHEFVTQQQSGRVVSFYKLK